MTDQEKANDQINKILGDMDMGDKNFWKRYEELNKIEREAAQWYSQFQIDDLEQSTNKMGWLICDVFQELFDENAKLRSELSDLRKMVMRLAQNAPLT